MFLLSPHLSLGWMDMLRPTVVQFLNVVNGIWQSMRARVEVTLAYSQVLTTKMMSILA
jgi:hypothetical protein